MDKLASLAKHIEIDFLKIIAEQLNTGEITLANAKQAAKDFLTLLPFSSKEDMQKKLKEFIVSHPKLEKVHAIMLTYIDEEKTTELLDTIRSYIHKLP
ncbi:hypothetical protein HY358_01820 [Candidatus Roizmanbacteria bacterium]|nr:hypothetical protein [Candidatus Roizmanbacteria bacterium]